MPKAVRAIQSSGQYRTTPLAPNTRLRQQQHLRQHIAQQVAQQQIHSQQQQQQQHFSANMQSLSHMSTASQHPSSYPSAPMPSSYMPQLSMSGHSQQHSCPSSYHQSTLPPPVQPPHYGMNLAASTRPSSGAWSPNEDSQLMSARAAGQNWSQIQSNHFPNKTANACRKRHERLMDKRNIDDWDALKLEQLGREYMAMRKEIWGPLAEKCNEKWSVIEAKVLGSGYKNLQSAARASHRRARLNAGGSVRDLDSHSLDAQPSSYTDDSALGDEGEYGDSPGTEYENYYDGAAQQQQQASKQRQHQRHSSSYANGGSLMLGGMGQAYGNGYQLQGQMMGRHAQGGNMGNNGRDMGIGSIINTASNGV